MAQLKDTLIQGSARVTDTLYTDNLTANAGTVNTLTSTTLTGTTISTDLLNIYSVDSNTNTTTQGINFYSQNVLKNHIGGTSALGLYSYKQIYLRPGQNSFSSDYGVDIDYVGMKPNGTMTLGKATDRWNGVYSSTGDFSGPVTITGNTSAAPLTLTGAASGYREGIRIKAYGSWSDIVLGGNDLTADSGISANSWFIGNNNGNFYITRNGSTSSSSAILSCVNNVWSWNGTASGTVSNVNVAATAPTASGIVGYLAISPGKTGSQALETQESLYLYDTITSGAISATYLNVGKQGTYMGGITLHSKTNSFHGDLVPTTLDANRTWTLPNATGTIALTSSSITGNAANVTGTVAIEHGGTGETSAIAGITALGGPYIGISGTALPEGANIDTYVTPGTYYSSASARTATLTGDVPVSGRGFKMWVIGGYGGNRFTQWVQANDKEIDLRYTNNNGETWTDWQTLVQMTAGANIGSATTPIYVDDDGNVVAGTTIKALAYKDSLATSDIPTISITDKTTGTLSIDRGGTGATSFSAGQAVIASSDGQSLISSGLTVGGSSAKINISVGYTILSISTMDELLLTSTKTMTLTVKTGYTLKAKCPRETVIFGGGKIGATYVAASGSTAATPGKPALWTFDCGISVPTNGTTITIETPVAGHDSGVFVSLDNGNTYRPVSISGATRLTTQYLAGHFVTLTFDIDGTTNSLYPIEGGTTRYNSNTTQIPGAGCWRVVNYYDSGAPYGIRVYNQTSGYNADYPLLVSRTALTTQIGTKNSNSSYSNNVYAVIWDSPNDGTHNKTPTLNPNSGLVKVYDLSVLGSKTKNYVLIAPSSANGAPTWRALDSADLPTVPYTKGGTGLTSLGSAGQVLKVNSSANGIEWGTVSTADEKVKVAANITTAADYPVVFANSNKSTTAAETAGLNKSGTKFYFNPSTGLLTATQVANAIWNDYAEYRKQLYIIQPGYVIKDTDSGYVIKANERLIPGAQIVSDTWGHSMGKTDECQTPVAVAGRVLAYTYRPREQYHAGMAVCSAPGGTIDIMTREEIRNYPDAIIGIVSEIPDYEEWGSGKVKVDGRIWIKVR